MTIVTTRGNGQSASSEMKILEYVSKYPRMSLVCRAHGSTATAPAAAMAMAQYQMMQSAMYGTDQRFTITSSGPALPSKRLPLWEMMTTSAGQGSARGGGLSILTERGNVRSVRADDSIFSVPADFTLVQ